MNCAICGREPGGFRFSPVGIPNAPKFEACSMTHLLLIQHGWKVDDVPDLRQFEAQAVDLAMEEVGAYIEACGTSDMAKFTGEQFAGLIATAFERVAFHIGELTDKNAVPF